LFSPADIAPPPVQAFTLVVLIYFNIKSGDSINPSQPEKQAAVDCLQRETAVIAPH
jgi:hypothetical protein